MKDWKETEQRKQRQENDKGFKSDVSSHNKIRLVMNHRDV